MKSSEIFGFPQYFGRFHFVYCEIHGFQLNSQYLKYFNFKSSIINCITVFRLLLISFAPETNVRFRRERIISMICVCVVYLYTFICLHFAFLSKLFAIFYSKVLTNLQISVVFLQISLLHIVKSMDFK